MLGLVLSDVVLPAVVDDPLLGVLLGWLFVQLFVQPGSAIIGIPVPESISPIVDLVKAPLMILVAGLIFGTIGFLIAPPLIGWISEHFGLPFGLGFVAVLALLAALVMRLSK